MKALVKAKAEPGLWLQDIPEPGIGINDVLIRVLKTGICGTDLHIYNWDAWAQKTIPVPMAVGHEFIGRIEKVGSNVNDFHPGDLVSGEGHVTCGRCRNCMAGRRHLCAHTQGVGVNRQGAFAELVALPMANILRSIVGHDHEAVESRFTAFAQSHALDSLQLRFLSLLKEHIRQYGALTPDKLFEAPFTTVHAEGLGGIFPNDQQLNEVVRLVRSFGAPVSALPAVGTSS